MLERMITKVNVLNIFLDRFLECLFTVFIAPLMTPRQVSGARGPGAGDPGLGVGAWVVTCRQKGRAKGKRHTPSVRWTLDIEAVIFVLEISRPFPRASVTFSWRAPLSSSWYSPGWQSWGGVLYWLSNTTRFVSCVLRDYTDTMGWSFGSKTSVLIVKLILIQKSLGPLYLV